MKERKKETNKERKKKERNSNDRIYNGKEDNQTIKKKIRNQLKEV